MDALESKAENTTTTTTTTTTTDMNTTWPTTTTTTTTTNRLIDTYDDYITFTKFGAIFFTIAIFIANVVLLFSIIRNYGVLKTCTRKRLTLISLAIGDIILALFPLIITTMEVFDSPQIQKMACSSKYLNVAYREYYINFVYGIGLVTLALDIRSRRDRVSEHPPQNVVWAFLYSAIPWLLCLILILPLTLADMDWSSCDFKNFNDDRMRAMYIVSVFLPIITAPCIAIFVMFSPKTQDSSILESTVPHLPPQGPHIEVPPNTHISYGSINTGRQRDNQGINKYRYPTDDDQHIHPDYTTDTTPFLQPSASIAYKDEKKTLLLISFVYFVCVFPRALAFFALNKGMADYYIIPYYYAGDPYHFHVYQYFSFWLMLCRSAVTPVIWARHVGRMSSNGETAPAGGQTV